MDFKISEEQSDVQTLARKILNDHCSNEQLREFDASPVRLNQGLWNKLAEAGLLGLAVDEQFGGMGYDFTTLCLFVEEVGRTVAATPAVPVLVSAAYALQCYGNAETKSEVLAKVVSGDWLITTALLEEGNDDPLLADTQAVYVDGQWLLDGDKACVPFARQAQRIFLSATTDAGLAVFSIDADASGLLYEEQLTTAGENQYALTLHKVHGRVVASGDDAIAFMRCAYQCSVAALCAQAVGVTDKMMRLTASYTSEREQFGVKIATFQAVGQRAADCYVDVECLRLVTQQAVYHCGRHRDASDEIRIAKVWAGDVCHRVSHAAQHLHGGMGVDRDYELWRFALWAKHIELSLGSSAQLLEQLGDSIASTFKAEPA